MGSFCQAFSGRARSVVAAAVAGASLLAVSPGCGTIAPPENAAEYCERIAVAICDDLFDTDCLEEELDVRQSRYKTQDECEKDEQAACDEIREADGVKYDKDKAFECLIEAEKMECRAASRASFGSCTRVFDNDDSPITPVGSNNGGDDDGGAP